MTFQDIFKSSFLENMASISILDMGIALFLAFLLGLFIFFIYKKSYSGVMYSASFGVTLLALTLITTLLSTTVVSNVVFVLVHCSGNCTGGGVAAAGGSGQRFHRRGAVCVCSQKNSGFALYPGGAL